MFAVCTAYQAGTQKKNRTTGDDLLSQRVAPQVPSALTSLTAGFGMGPGVTSSLQSPIVLFFLLV
jgi:hypothetical protein